MKKYIILGFLLIASFIVLYKIRKNVKVTHNPENYIYNEGLIFGSNFHLIYESPDKQDFINDIMKLFQDFDSSMSTYNTQSIISRINRNEPNVLVDSIFIEVFNKSMEISEKTGGAFDITVAPLVNAWGFGFKNQENVDSLLIDSLLQYVGYKKVKIEGNILKKESPGIMLDASAIAPGYASDILAKFLEKRGCQNYMIEISGEIRLKGVNKENKKWRIGIDKPIEDPTAENREIQDIIQVSNLSLATSGNYRKFYVKDGKKYAHTINPKTGYPIRHELLSATVFAPDCMSADAYATSFMVLGLQKSLEVIKNNPFLNAYFIYTDSAGNMAIKYTSGVDSILVKE